MAAQKISALIPAITQEARDLLLGYSQIGMTSRYAHALSQVMSDAAERIGQALWGEP